MKFSPDEIAAVRTAFPKLDVDSLVRKTESRLSMPGARVIDNTAPYLWKVCESAESEGRSMKGSGVAHSFRGEQDLPANIGFDASGKVMRSAVPIRNSATEFAKFAVREIRTQLLTPADFVSLLRNHPPECQALFSPDVTAAWCVLGTLDGWASALAHTSLEEHVRSWGSTWPWAKDSNLWDERRAAWVARQAPEGV
jgi:hypothetical protein